MNTLCPCVSHYTGIRYNADTFGLSDFEFDPRSRSWHILYCQCQRMIGDAGILHSIRVDNRYLYVFHNTGCVIGLSASCLPGATRIELSRVNQYWGCVFPTPYMNRLGRRGLRVGQLRYFATQWHRRLCY